MPPESAFNFHAIESSFRWLFKHWLNSLCFCFASSKRFISTSGEMHMGKCLRKLIYLNELVGILNLWLRTNSLRKGQYKRIFEDKKSLDDRADLGK